MSTNPVFTDGCVRHTDSSKIWDVVAGPPLYTAGKGRFGVPGLTINSFFGRTCARVFSNNPSTLFADFAVQWTALGQTLICAFSDGTTVQCGLVLLATGQLQFVRSTGTLIGSPSALTYPANTINQMEIKAVIDNSTGSLELRVNGNTTPVITFSGDTTSTANNFASRISFQGGANGLDLHYSDFVLFDGGGSAPNTFLGNKRVQTVVPVNDSATGGLNQFSTQPSQTAGNHYKNVDETPPTNDTDYNFDSVATDRESYQIGAVASGATGIVGVNVCAFVRNDDATPHTYKVTSRSVATDALSGDINPAATYRYDYLFQAVDPNTSAAWTEAGINASEIGVQITS